MFLFSSFYSLIVDRVLTAHRAVSPYFKYYNSKQPTRAMPLMVKRLANSNGAQKSTETSINSFGHHVKHIVGSMRRRLIFVIWIVLLRYCHMGLRKIRAALDRPD